MPENKVEKVIALLKENYTFQEKFCLSNPMDVLVETILSQNTNDKNTFIAFRNLKNKYKNYEEVLKADEKELARVIYSSGFHNLKAKRIQQTLGKIKNEVGSLNIDFLKEKNKEEAFEWLTKLPGIGHKTAAIILTFGLNHPAIAVDTHIFRVSHRLGLVPEKFDREKTQEFLEKIIPNDLKNFVHNSLIKHGREICIARKPKCSECFLKKECDYFLRGSSYFVSCPNTT